MKCIIQYQDDSGTEWLVFDEPIDIIEAASAEDVVSALNRVEESVGQDRYAAGYVTYEAAQGLDPTLTVQPKTELPLVKFGIYTHMERHKTFPQTGSGFDLSGWHPSVELSVYQQHVEKIKEWIAAGDTYQVNYTLHLQGLFRGSASDWFACLWRSQRPRYAAYVEDDGHIFCSASPELFFSLNGKHIVCRPMKGTQGRGRTAAADSVVATRLQESAKDRAENVMIVDMMRNDLGRIAEVGTVHAGPLFDVEKYPTLWQMTSTVRAETHAAFADIMRGLFPCSSITGAPKRRTMEIIRMLEDHPRGIYTGTIGYLSPHHPITGKRERSANFNVAIRTAHIRTATGHVQYGTGGGIVWDSVPEQEHRECQTKALILSRHDIEFALLETLLWRPQQGGFLLRGHEKRVADSARYFDIPFDLEVWRDALAKAVSDLPPTPHRVRVTVSKEGRVRVETYPLLAGRTNWGVEIASQPVRQEDPFLYHKTTYRTTYERIKQQHPDADDVILWNEAGEITESCFANVIALFRGEWCTPPVECGLLNGILRQTLVERNRLKERILTIDQLQAAERVLLINSVRGAIRLHWINAGRGST